MAMATGQGTIEPEAAVHWVPCKHCNMYPIRGELFTCMVCRPDYNLCKGCNDVRRADYEKHPHRFDFFYMPRACNPPPNQIGGNTAQTVGSVVPTQAPAPAASPFITPPPPGHQPFQVPHAAAAATANALAGFQNIQILPQTGPGGQPIILLVQPDQQQNLATAPAPQEPTPPSEPPYEPPAPLDHTWRPRNGLSDEYYHNTAYATQGGHCTLTDHQHYPIAVAKVTYMAGADDELSFPEGGQILVTEFCNRSWWRGEWKGLQRLFPCQLVELECTENLAA